MNPRDEGFVRQVAASLGDDAPRLVYADWLEEQGDPRGDYLRAEMAWAAKRRDRKRLESKARKLSLPLDPVWAAGVSRPPLGVCCDHVRFSKRGPERTPADLDAVEKRLGSPLPSDYRAFLLNYNGGVPSPCEAPDPNDPDMPLKYSHFFWSVGGRGEHDCEHELRWMRSIRRVGGDYLPFHAEGMLPVADACIDLGRTLIDLDPERCGRVVHFTDSSRCWDYDWARYELARSFAELLAQLGTR